DRYFETIHERSAKHIAKAFNLGYTSAVSMLGLKIKFSRFLNSNEKPQILEIQTPRKLNDSILLDYFKWMRAKA
ncbi:2-succinyl-5-enolpyruvyl-6-hydroxy-3-cyclohexene-1-carboxylate synthase, partial [Flavobacteriaceae bacterium]|nr:2-succinyl-5-enolpyruvyl-6-hydroxy-3-cyclohexene-1-carboxylate synthase [Flavobacteriaceae bacterium]